MTMTSQLPEIEGNHLKTIHKLFSVFFTSMSLHLFYTINTVSLH
ncbi:Uncharacterised protein [Legionella spiritensis]|nr:Uncharacterised protein [Legionella spiritensis]